MAELSDKEITEACARAMGIPASEFRGDDAQAMELLRRFDIVIEPDPKRTNLKGVTIFAPTKWTGGSKIIHTVRRSDNLRISIFECVAVAQIEKEKNRA